MGFSFFTLLLLLLDINTSKKGTWLKFTCFSDFITEVDGRLKFEEEEACVNCVMMKPGTNRDGWWKTDDLIKQITEKEIHIFENYILPGGKGKFKDGIMPADGSVQPMHLPNGQPKGIKLVLEERGLWPQNQLKRICDDCKKHSPTSDNFVCFHSNPIFLVQKSLIQEIIENRGHKVIFYLKFHCELNFKRYTRNNCDYSFKKH
ncbi:unnamed protein product [Rhizophagus irregularis]|nr:unnamed protein product [Rhizophagus irregularis]